MSDIVFNNEIKIFIDSILLKIPGVVAGKMFGFPAYFINKKLFACIYENGIGVKIPANMASELIGKDGIIHFQPLGKSKMKEWIQISRDNPDEYIRDMEIFLESVKFVSHLTK